MSRFRRRSLSSPDVWNVAPAEGIEIQKRLRPLVRRSWDGRAIALVAGGCRHPRIPRSRARRFERFRGALRVSVRPRSPFVSGDSGPSRCMAGTSPDARLHSLRRSGDRASPRARAREPSRARSRDSHDRLRQIPPLRPARRAGTESRRRSSLHGSEGKNDRLGSENTRPDETALRVDRTPREPEKSSLDRPLVHRAIQDSRTSEGGSPPCRYGPHLRQTDTYQHIGSLPYFRKNAQPTNW
jgi:hypothetical protein